jgi:hypothetical protein
MGHNAIGTKRYYIGTKRSLDKMLWVKTLLGQNVLGQNAPETSSS